MGGCDYQTYCHVRASTMTATATNKLNSAQTFSRLWPVLSPCVVMATSIQDTLAVVSKHIRFTNKKSNDLNQIVEIGRGRPTRQNWLSPSIIEQFRCPRADIRNAGETHEKQRQSSGKRKRPQPFPPLGRPGPISQSEGGQSFRSALGRGLAPTR